MAKKKTSLKKKIKSKSAKKSPSRQKSTSKRKTKKVSPVPKGYHNVTPYLLVNDAPAAIEFYKKAFGAKERMRSNGPEGKIAHAELQIGDSKIMLSDMCDTQNVTTSTSLIHLYIKDVDNVVDKAVSAGAKLMQAVENMFYGDRSGMIVDPFGHQWNIATHMEDLSMKELKKRAQSLGKNLVE